MTFFFLFYFFTHLLHVCDLTFFHKQFIFIIVVRGYKTKVHSLHVQEPGFKPNAVLEW